VLDWHSRRVLAHRVSITMEADFCVDALAEAVARYGAPQIMNFNPHIKRYELPPPALAGWLASECATAVLSVAASIVRITLVAQWMPPACV
jgi:transposase InsO family protein